ncbi:MAG: hypothetical protein ACTSPV_16360 [Candidatus Hodarchaeales archaeon]
MHKSIQKQPKKTLKKEKFRLPYIYKVYLVDEIKKKFPLSKLRALYDEIMEEFLRNFSEQEQKAVMQSKTALVGGKIFETLVEAIETIHKRYGESDA